MLMAIVLRWSSKGDFVSLSLGVNDHALDPNFSGSIPASVEEFSPHAVLSMGVHSASHYALEHHADNGGLGGDDNAPEHVWGASATHDMPANYSLARAIVEGSAATTSADASLPPVG